jgi:two-component system chemotaxis response regulator CheB
MAMFETGSSRRPQASATEKRNVIVFGASAGGVAALQRLFEKLPSTLAAAIFVVLHSTSHGLCYMDGILSKAGGPKAHFVKGRERICFGETYVAPANHHLRIEDGTVEITTGPKENRHRPAINPLFRSAAYSFGSRVIGVVLTGMMDDGAAGLWEIKRRGGIAVVQDPLDAEYPSMPNSALADVNVDHVVSLEDMPSLLISLCKCEVET